MGTYRQGAGSENTKSRREHGFFLNQFNGILAEGQSGYSDIKGGAIIAKVTY